MSDLQIAPAPEKSVLPALLIALLVLAGVAAAVFYFNPHTVADLHVTGLQTFAPHTEIKALQSAETGGMRVLSGAVSAPEDDLYVVATVSLADRLRIPLYLTDVSAHVTFADGTQTDAGMISAMDVSRLETVFPAIKPLVGQPPLTALDQEVDPGQTLAGTVVFAFPGKTAQAWTSRRAATLSIQLRNQQAQTTPLP